ncbi:O-antigen polysaccharide polymerase Wzy [Pseudonocardia lacus]|uniref:O-antigen polysaccharide polymerase Wzy n=1 Tax=Pseudonocardia lacus TaxID=2835865 RepID=UPI001BDBEEC3|nr:O-antigen polysaccharide polymerase Wzy [Pseudonocardia lacus]
MVDSRSAAPRSTVRQSGKSPGHWALILVTAGLGLHEVVTFAAPRTLQQSATVFVLAWALCLALAARRASGGVYSPAAAYLAVFGLFHGGLLLDIALRGTSGLSGADISWLLGGLGPPAAALATVGMVAFTLGAEFVPRPRSAPAPQGADLRERQVLGRLGLAVQLIGLVIFTQVVVGGGGLGLLRSGYLSYLEAAQGSGLLPYGILALGVGPVLAITAGGWHRRVAWAAFVAFALVAFPLGLRGEVLFPLVAMLVIEVRRGRRFSVLWTAVGAMVVLLLIGVVRRTRTRGLDALLDPNALTSPLDGAAEMGFSLRPVVAVLGWHERGEPFRHGETLLVVPMRTVERLAGYGTPEYDDRLFNVEIMQRVGPIGGSPVAEAYHNFGVVGVVAVMAVLGVVLGVLARRRRTPLDDALLGSLLTILLIQVRNSFAAVPAQVLLVAALLVVVRLVTVTRDETTHPRRGPS